MKKQLMTGMVAVALMAGGSIHAMDTQAQVQPTQTYSQKLKSFFSSDTAQKIATTASDMVTIASLDAISNSIVAGVGASYGNVAGHLTAAAANSLLIIQLKAIDEYRNGTLSAESLLRILPFNSLMNLKGIRQKPFESIALNALSMASLAGNKVLESIAAVASLAVKTSLLNSGDEAAAYNLYGNLTALIPARSLVAKVTGF